MLKIERIGDTRFNHLRFRLTSETSLDYCSYVLTLFGRTWRIKYSSKLNYFFMARQIRKQHFVLEGLAISYLHLFIQLKTNKTIADFQRLNTGGGGADFFFRCSLDGEDVFIKVILGRIQSDNKNDPVMENEYKYNAMLSKDSPYILKPIHYIQDLPCEILIMPFIHNMRPLISILSGNEPAPEWIKSQLEDIAETLKSKKLVHRDIHGQNIVLGSIHGKPEQLFLIDCAFMTQVDNEGNIVPTNMENKISHHLKDKTHTDDDFQFAQLLSAVNAKLASHKERERERERERETS